MRLMPNPLRLSVVVWGRMYAGTLNVPMEVPDFDGEVLVANGWTALEPPGSTNESAISLSDTTEDNASCTKHGFAPKLPCDITMFYRGDGTWAVPPASGDVSSDSSASIDGEIAMFKGTTGKVIKRASLTGIVKATSGVISAATANTDYLEPTGNGSQLVGITANNVVNTPAGGISSTDVQGALNELDTTKIDLSSLITGFVSSAGTVTANDSVLSALGKLDGNDVFTRSAGVITQRTANDTVNLTLASGSIKIGSLDAFSRPQLMLACTDGLLRLGSNASDGDPTGNIPSQGVAVWNTVDGDFGARIKANRFGLTAATDSALYYFRADDTQLFFKDSALANIMKIDRATKIVSLGAASTNTGSLTLYNATNANTVKIQSGVTTATYTMTLPTSAGNSGQALVTDGTGATSWASVGTFTSNYYVDGTVGNDTTADGSVNKPYATIQACLNAIGQPINKADYMRHVIVNVMDKLSASAGSSPQSWDGVYEENLCIPCRNLTFISNGGVKVGNNGANTTYGNVIVEMSSSRRFGAGSSDYRPCITWMGRMNSRDTHNRLRNGFQIGDSSAAYRVAVLRRLSDSIQGDGVNKITVHITAGQNPYQITIPSTYPTEPYIRINVNGTTNYNGNYDITSQVSADTFIATRVSGTNANTGIETGAFFESDSAGASGITHDSAFVNCYLVSPYTCDDGTVNTGTAGGAPTAGTEVLYAVNSKFYGGIQGRGILCQRWDNNTVNAALAVLATAIVKGQKYTIASLGSTDFTLIGAASNTVGVVFVATGTGAGNGTATLSNIVSSISQATLCSFANTFEVSTFTYSTDDMGFMNCKFSSATIFTVSSAAQTVRMDSVSYESFLASGSSWATNTPTVANLDNDISRRLFTAKGDLIVGTASNAVVTLPVGATNGHVLTVDSTTASGLKYAAAAGGTTWTVITANQSITAGDVGYMCNGGAQIVLTLPTTAAVGTKIQACAHNANGWKIAQNAGQTIYVGTSNTTTGVTGYLSSTGAGDTMELVCVVANTDWREVDMQGNITIA